MSEYSEMIYDACVIGAGASGLVCASGLAKRGYSTLLIEQNKKSGRKLYATGNGRCNIANAVILPSSYYGDGFAREVVTEGSLLLLTRYLEEIGIPLTEKNGYMYPQSLQASSVVWALTDAARLAGAEFLYGMEMSRVERTQEGGFILTLTPGEKKEKASGEKKEASSGDKKDKASGVTADEEGDGPEKIMIRCNRLVLASGSPAAEELGAAREDTLYSLLDDLHLPYEDFAPALCPLEVAEDVHELAGVRVKARIRMGMAMDRPEMDENLSETGELQLTEYGLSGIAVFNLSTLVQEGEKVSVDLLPLWEKEEELLHFLQREEQSRTIFGGMNGLLHEKLCSFFLTRAFGSRAKKLKLEEASDEELLELIRSLKDWRLTAVKKRGEQGQACRGGVYTHILDPNSMQVKRDRRLAVIGEVCNVTGRCGGYNLMFAMISGMRAGQKL